MYSNPQQLKGGLMSGARNKILDQFSATLNINGYSVEFCQNFAEMFVDDKKNVKPCDIIFLNAIHCKRGGKRGVRLYTADKQYDWLHIYYNHSCWFNGGPLHHYAAIQERH